MRVAHWTRWICCSNAHKLAPENVDVIFLMAQISMSQNYFEDAIPLLESGLQIAPQRADLIAALGESYFMAGKVDKAIDQFAKLVKIENSARSYSFLGISYRNLGGSTKRSNISRRGSNSTRTIRRASLISDSSQSGREMRPRLRIISSRPFASIRIFPTHYSNSPIFAWPRRDFQKRRSC